MILKSNHEFLLVVQCHWAEYRRKPLLNFGFIVSLAIATSTLLSILVLNHASKEAYQTANESLKPPVTLTIVSNTRQPISTTDYFYLKKLGFHQLSPIHVFEKQLKNNKKITFRAIDILPLVLTLPTSFSSQKVNLSNDYANKLDLSATQKIILKNGISIDRNIHNRNDLGEVALIDLILAWKIFPEIKGFSQLIATELLDDEIIRLEQHLPDHLSIIKTWSIEQRAGFADALHLNLSALGILAFIVSLFIAFQAANQAWAKRAELATQLRLFGVNLATIQVVMLLEALLLAVISTCIGMIIAITLVGILLPILGLTLEQLYQLKLNGDFQWQWQYSGWAFAIASVAVLSALIKQFRLLCSAKIALAARAIKPSFNQLMTLSIAVILILAFFMWPTQSWFQLMIKYGFLLMASTAILPNILSWLLRVLVLLTRSFRLQYVFKDAGQQVSRRFLPLAAFYLALTASIAAALMINSFESSFISYLNRLLNSDVFISYSSEQKSEVYNWLKEQPEIDELVLFQKAQAQVANDNIDLYEVKSAKQHASLLFKVKASTLLPSTIADCYINEQLAYKRSILLQQQITIKQATRELICRVIGIYYDYGNQTFVVKVIGEAAMDNFTGWQETGFGVFFKKNKHISSADIIDRLSLSSSQVYEPEQIKKIALKVFKQTFVLTQAIALVLLTIACLGLFMSAHALELARKADLHLLISVGYHPSELFRHMLLQWFVLAIGCILLSWPVAVILAKALVTLILPASFGWSMPLMLNIAPFAVSSLMGLLVLIPALAIPLYHINLRACLS